MQSRFVNTISFFREQGMEHSNSDRICQVNPIYLDLRVDFMLYCVLHWTFHSSHGVMLIVVYQLYIIKLQT